MTNKCTICGKDVKKPKRIDVPEGAIICDEHFTQFTWKCGRCDQTFAVSANHAGECGEESPVADEYWCRQCCQNEAAYCQWCKQIFWAGYLVWGHGGMLCPWCLRRLDMIKNDCASPADEELLESIVHDAIQALPEHLQEMLECRDVGSPGGTVTQQLNIVLVGSGDPDDALVTVKSCQTPARLYSVFCAPGTPQPDDELLEGSYFWSVSIHGRMVGFLDFPGDEVYDVDLQLAVLNRLAGALCKLGIIDRDDCGRFIDKQKRLVFDWEQGL